MVRLGSKPLALLTHAAGPLVAIWNTQYVTVLILCHSMLLIGAPASGDHHSIPSFPGISFLNAPCGRLQAMLDFMQLTYFRYWNDVQ